MTWILIFGLLAAASLAAPTLIGSSILYFAGFISGIVAKLLDLVLWALVVKFDSVIYGTLSQVIASVWTVCRDVSNIFIIGIFTFIALQIILGIETLSPRKMVARVLLIAVLINFSLLFTRVIIGTSNFVAGKFYCSMALNVGQTTACGDAPVQLDTFLASGISDNGIGGTFMGLLGLDGILQSPETISKIYQRGAATDNGVISRATFGFYSVDGGTMALLYSITASFLMLSAAVMFAYMAFLLIARTVLFVFLLFSSSLAFAVFLVPKSGEKYWNMWWGSLLQNAVFGPVLMILLSATLAIAQALVQAPGA